MTENPYQSPETEEPLSGDPRPQQAQPGGAIAYGVAVRILGLTSMLYGAWYLFFGFLYLSGIPQASDGDMQVSAAGGLFMFFTGLLLIGFAPLIVRLSYPRSSPPDHV